VMRLMSPSDEPIFTIVHGKATFRCPNLEFDHRLSAALSRFGHMSDVSAVLWTLAAVVMSGGVMGVSKVRALRLVRSVSISSFPRAYLLPLAGQFPGPRDFCTRLSARVLNERPPSSQP
jgi:hypothetical protein